jgi:hypothetical protein
MNENDGKLAGLTREANEAHAQAQQCYKSGVENAISAGRALAKAKRHVQHGRWGAWLADQTEQPRIPIVPGVALSQRIMP